MWCYLRLAALRFAGAFLAAALRFAGAFFFAAFFAGAFLAAALRFAGAFLAALRFAGAFFAAVLRVLRFAGGMLITFCCLLGTRNGRTPVRVRPSRIHGDRCAPSALRTTAICCEPATHWCVVADANFFDGHQDMCACSAPPCMYKSYENRFCPRGQAFPFRRALRASSSVRDGHARVRVETHAQRALRQPIRCKTG